MAGSVVVVVDKAGVNAGVHEEPAVDGDAELGDALPDDLDISGLTGIYEFPNNSKRKIASVLYVAVGALCVVVGLTAESPLVNTGVTVAGIGLLVFAAYGFMTAVETQYDEADALVAAGRVVGFAVGPASAQMVWRGWRSRPAWRVLLYSAEPVPEQRAIAVVDAVDGSVIEHLVEANPEDWSTLDR